HAIMAKTDLAHGDQTVSLTVGLIDSIGRVATRSEAAQRMLRRLADAHAEFSDGLLAHKRAAYEEAEGKLGHAAQELRALGSPAAGWGSLQQGSEELNRSLYDAADTRLQQVIAGASALQPALTGTAVWARGLIAGRRGNLEAANRFYLDARPHLARANEPEN